MSAFINPWFISIWVENSGNPLLLIGGECCWAWTFSAQAIVCTFGLIPVYVLLHRYGGRMRKPLYLVAVSS
ncbi:transporter [Penicillium riverlandense]|uniref:transporter n=1 Tax=Penicillium riverlandense TaxID=1903569 RepID=UPI0025490CDA|nr:transporter [Penicillium riverlandense]KAJ5807782.1 transporter [Penicillium riverlandense]